MKDSIYYLLEHSADEKDFWLGSVFVILLAFLAIAFYLEFLYFSVAIATLCVVILCFLRRKFFCLFASYPFYVLSIFIFCPFCLIATVWGLLFFDYIPRTEIGKMLFVGVALVYIFFIFLLPTMLHKRALKAIYEDYRRQLFFTIGKRNDAYFQLMKKVICDEKELRGLSFALYSVYKEDVLAKEEWQYVLAMEFQLFDYSKTHLKDFNKDAVKELEALIEAYCELYERFSSFLEWIKRVVDYSRISAFYLHDCDYIFSRRVNAWLPFCLTGLCFVERKGRSEELYSKYDFDLPLIWGHISINNFLYNKKRFITALEEELRSLKELRGTFLSAGRF